MASKALQSWGKARIPSIADLVTLGVEAKLPRQTIDGILEQTKAALAKWKVLAGEHGVSRSNRDLIAGKISAINASG